MIILKDTVGGGATLGSRLRWIGWLEARHLDDAIAANLKELVYGE